MGRSRRFIVGALAVAAATVTTFVTPHSSATPTAVEAATATSRYVALIPCRLADERSSTGFLPIDPSTARISADACEIPTEAVSIVVSTTIVRAHSKGWLITYPSGAPRPNAATLNWNKGTTRANTATVALGADRHIAVYRDGGFGNGDAVIDVVGAFVPADSATSGRFVSAPVPERLLDTRDEDGTAVGPDTAVRVPLPPGVPTDASALAINLTVVETRSNGFFTTYAAGSERPTASVLNADRAGQFRAAATIVPVTEDGFEVYTNAGAHLIVDMTGWFTGESAVDSTDGLFVAINPQRLRDTRAETYPLYPDGTVEISIPDRAGQPAAVAISMTMINPEAPGFVAAHAARTERGATSSGYGLAHEVTAQFGIVAASPNGVGIYSRNGTEMTVDLLGWFTGPQTPAALAAPASNPVPRQRVIAIGDSSLAGIDRNQAWAQLRGADFDLRARSCRRLVRPSCSGIRDPTPPPTALDTLRSLPRGHVDIAVIMTGYNDVIGNFASAVPTIIQAARQAGIRRIIWLTHTRALRADKGGQGAAQVYALHNDVIQYHGANNHDVFAMEWGLIVRHAPFWVYPDGIHLDRYGGHGNADFISRAVAHVTGQPCPMPVVLGGSTTGTCPDPSLGPPVDIAALYGV
jgi:hypothetical protein